MRRALGCCALLWAGLACAAEPSLTQKQADAQTQRTELRARIASLQDEIDRSESSRRDAASQLKASETAISASNRRLAELAERQRAAERELKDLGAQIVEQKQQLTVRQHELGEQMRAQYAGGLSPWTALLSGDNPQAIGRDLRYLGYITQAQADAVIAVNLALDKLARLQARSEEQTQKLAQLAQETTDEKSKLEEQKAEHQKVLKRIETELQAQRGQAAGLKQNDERLGKLISGLEVAIAKQREAARIAEEKRRAEAARLAEAKRRADVARKAEQARQAEAARQAALAEQKARTEADRQVAEQVRLQVERARAEARAKEEAAAAKAKTEAAAAAQTVRSEPAGGFQGLGKRNPYPVSSNDILGRFGAERPEGGLWRGIVLRAPQGSPIKAIAAGRVVYANWLSGFGNIMIVDHGAKYLSVYAYNQSLLKRVGDIVGAGDTIATVGATGGQVESGLYFEIRHQGVPVNPLLWLRR
ncbi:murein hydrolase activator EnvC family protein [Pollutimonas harenae]|uniref:Peptidoglycan DD-metalloendopeptidase family protein n=1 Tax=Pollutimonas harenae TaxID=657015 RepID=A0A853GTX6_9BURK|nr:peptidoglycan DD-metalloendopeptidase family protein [Pollutimonas harenae]NYT84236.1 peptidoglycan DD-metalloendopeptidase family protein [Pollutimonas harenae]TEA73350.1 peptidase [Pollutimonas harenae]